MITKNIIRAIAYLFLQLMSGVLIFTALVIAGRVLRDGFCYPSYIQDLSLSVAVVALVAAVVLTPGAAVAAWTLGEMRLRWSIVMLPHGLAFLSLLSLFVADVVMRLSNRAHCASGLPEVQDKTAHATITSEVLTYTAAAAGIGALLASIIIVLRMLTVANRRNAT